MISIADEDLYKHANRTNGCSIIITGAASGIGKETALNLSKYGGNIIIADLNISVAEEVAAQITKLNGNAVAKKCDVTDWHEQREVFEFALQTFGSVDIVIANAGVTEIGKFAEQQLDGNGLLLPPVTTTLEVNLKGVVYTTALARHYLPMNHDLESPTKKPKALILLGSMASWQAIPLAPCYSASKHAVLGLMRSITPDFQNLGIRVASVHPFFADTSIVPAITKIFLAGIKFVPLPRIAGAIVHAATSPEPENNGASWLLLDGDSHVRIEQEDFKTGVYGEMDRRFNALWRIGTGIKYYAKIFDDVSKALKVYTVGYIFLSMAGVGVAYMYRVPLGISN